MNNTISPIPDSPPVECIYCNSDEISYVAMDYGETELWRTVYCYTCKKSFLEVYKWSHAEEIPE